MLRFAVHRPLALALAACGLLTGCASGPSSIPSPVAPASIGNPTGQVHGGQNPVSGARIRLWEVGGSGYGSGATDLLAGSTVLTNGNGAFRLPTTYTCPNGDPYLYLTATGGNPGLLDPSTNNSAILLLTLLSDCNTFKANQSTTFLTVNELTTVAAAYALNWFIDPVTGEIGSYASLNQPLLNGFKTFNNLVDPVHGTARTGTPFGNGIVPQQELNHLGNALAPCVNSSGPTAPDCVDLFTAVDPAAPTSLGNVLQAVQTIARNPGANVMPIFRLPNASSAPFVPGLSAQPNDWTVALSFADGTVGTEQLAIDGLGNVWATSDRGSSGSTTLSMLDPSGIPSTNTPLSPESATSGTASLAIDSGNRVWMANSGTGDAFLLNTFFNNGRYTIDTLNGPIDSGLDQPVSIALDSLDNPYFADNGSSAIVELDPASDSSIASFPAISPLTGLAFDSAGNFWATGSSLQQILLFGSNSLSTSIGESTTQFGYPTGIAIGPQNTAWFASGDLGGALELSQTAALLSPLGGFQGGGSGAADDLAIDGAGNVWAANLLGSSISGFTPQGQPITSSNGYLGGNLSSPDQLAIDGTGNLWVANAAPVSVGGRNQTISEFVGLAAPVATPIAVQAAGNRFGRMPGTAAPIDPIPTALPDYLLNQPYAAQIYATGGSGNGFVFSTADPLPTGITLSSTGSLSGTPSAVAASSTFHVTVADSLNPAATASAPYSLSPVPASPTLLGGESVLAGAYAFRYTGYRNRGQNPTPGTIYATTLIGSITFDGAGNVTAGEIDQLTPNGNSLESSSSVTGSYSIAPGSPGTMVLTIPGAQHPLELAFAVSQLVGGVAQTFDFISFTDTKAATGGSGGDIGAGTAKLQSSGAFTSSTLNRTFVFGLEGESPCTDYQSTNPSCPRSIAGFGPLVVVGQFTGNAAGAITAGREDATAIGNSYPTTTLTGAITSPDAFGRGTLTLTPAGSIFANPPTGYIYYIVDSGELFLMSAQPHTNYAELIGDALAQSGTFSNATPAGTFIGWENASYGGDGFSQYPTQSAAALYRLAFNNTSDQVTAMADSNTDGVLQYQQDLGTLGYAVDASGRMALSESMSSGPVFYFIDSTQAFGLMQPQNAGDPPGFLTLKQQTGSPFSSASLAGAYGIASVRPPTQISVTAAEFTSGGSGNGTANASSSAVEGVLSTGSLTFTYTTDATGRTVTTDNTGNTGILYLIGPTEAVSFTASRSNHAPTILHLQQ